MKRYQVNGVQVTVLATDRNDALGTVMAGLERLADQGFDDGSKILDFGLVGVSPVIELPDEEASGE